MTEKDTSNPKKINATPEKQFFISMLIKDIELLPAIVDLVDNSVDAARATRGAAPYNGLYVKLTVKPEGFQIVDNCGGLKANVARDYAFRFGRPRGFQPIPSSVGQFGVGMKRALFKLGSAFTIESAAADSTFRLEVDVETWAAEDGSDWSFDFAEVDYETGVSEDDRFTDISVPKLHPHVVSDFGRPPVIKRLMSQLALKHQSAIQRGLRVSVNDASVQSSVPALLKALRLLQ